MVRDGAGAPPHHEGDGFRRAALSPSLRAKRSNPEMHPRRQSGLLRRFAPRNDDASDSCDPNRRSWTPDTPSHSRGMFCPSFASTSHPLKQKGAGKTGCRPAPMASVLNGCAMMHRGNTGGAGNARPSLRSGLTAYGVLSPETNSFLSPSPRELAMHQIPVGSMHLRESLTVATTARTTRFCRTRRRRSSARCISLTV